jgi:selenocysteine lyase/cysteine desulfurase
MLPCQRHRFQIPRDHCYLNAAYMTPAPTDFIAIGEQSLIARTKPWTVSPADFFKRSERVRSLAAQVMECAPSAVAIVPSVSYGVATAARNLPIRKGQVIITLSQEFPSNYYGWDRLAKDRGAELLMVPGPPEQNWTEAILAFLQEHGPRTALLAIPHVHWSTGAMLDLPRIRDAARQHGAALFLDLTQSLGALPISLAEIDPDFAVAAGYKWLFGPYSLGYLYVSPRWQGGIPLEENWIVRAGAEDFSQLVAYQNDYQPGARRFDMGERSNFQLMPLAESALKMILDWQIDEIAPSLAAINSRLADILHRHGFETTPHQWRSPHLMAARSSVHKASDIAARLKDEKIFVSNRGDWIRIAPHLWIDDHDEAHLDEALGRL